MKQLSVIEMDAISGGYSWDFSSVSAALTSIVGNCFEAVGSALLAGSIAGMYGSTIAGSQGGNGGGLLGVGTLGQGVGIIWGLVVGAIGGGLAGALVGWDVTFEKTMALIDGLFDGTNTPWVR